MTVMTNTSPRNLGSKTTLGKAREDNFEEYLEHKIGDFVINKVMIMLMTMLMTMMRMITMVGDRPDRRSC